MPPPTVELVLAHCHENVTFLAAVQRGLRAAVPDAAIALHVYEKCDDRSETLWPRTGWAYERRTYLPNRGEECLAYLTHVVSTWHAAAPDFYVFLQGDGVMSGRGFGPKFRAFGEGVVRARRRDVFRSINDHQYRGVGATRAACAAAGLTAGLCQPNSRMARCMRELVMRNPTNRSSAAAAAAALAPAELDVWATFNNAQFGVSSDRLRERPLSYWRGLLAELEGPESTQCLPSRNLRGGDRPLRGTCALFEVLWPSLMGEARVLPRSRTMMEVGARGGTAAKRARTLRGRMRRRRPAS